MNSRADVARGRAAEQTRAQRECLHDDRLPCKGRQPIAVIPARPDRVLTRGATVRNDEPSNAVEVQVHHDIGEQITFVCAFDGEFELV